MLKQAHSNGVNMPDVASLTSEVNRLTEAVGFWNTAIIVMLVFTTMAAAGLVITQRIAFKRADSLATVTGQLSQLKDQISEGKIADAREAAAQANKSAAENQKETALLTAQNLKLEAAIAPRRLSAKQQTELAGTNFAGQTVEIRSYGNDIEGLVLADQIVQAVRGRVRLLDNRSTLQPAGSVQYGIIVTGSDNALVSELSSIFASLVGKPSPPSSSTTFTVGFGQKFNATPPAVIITVGVKPIK